MLKWQNLLFNVFLDGKIFTYLKNKKKLIQMPYFF